MKPNQTCPCGPDCKCGTNCPCEKNGSCGTCSIESKKCARSCCHFWAILCVISCIFCAGVMIWGAYVMHRDLIKMETLMNPSNVPLMTQSSPSKNISSIQGQTNDPMREHCKMMPNMMGCEVYKNGQGGMNMMMDPMDMSMMQMGQMLAGKTGDDLDRAFIEGMIPHHQAAVDMARYLTGAKHPELQKMGQDIIAAQSKEIDQMKKWQAEWGYTK